MLLLTGQRKKSGNLQKTVVFRKSVSVGYKSVLTFEALGTFAKLRKATVAFVLSVCPSECDTSVPIGRILIKVDVLWSILRISAQKTHG